MAFATIDVTKGITGTIPVANGGTGLASGTSGQFLKFTGSTTVASSALGATGKIVGHAHAITSSETATNSGSAVATTLTVDYTATSTSNSLLIFVNHAQYYMNSPEQALILELWKDSSVLDRIQQGVGYSDSAAHISGGSLVYKASIGDTNSHTYKTMFWRQVGSGYVYTQVNTSASSITVQEIAS